MRRGCDSIGFLGTGAWLLVLCRRSHSAFSCFALCLLRIHDVDVAWNGFDACLSSGFRKPDSN